MKTTERQEWLLAKARDINEFWGVGEFEGVDGLDGLVGRDRQMQLALNNLARQVGEADLYYGGHIGGFAPSLTGREWKLVRLRAGKFLAETESKHPQRVQEMARELSALIEALWREAQ